LPNIRICRDGGSRRAILPICAHALSMQHSRIVEKSAGWGHLVPYVDALVEAGNPTASDGFKPNQGGWDCWMREPIDLAILRPLMAVDPCADQIKLGPDGLDCLHCWASIHSAPSPK
jgi:hypothetical protein